MKNLSSPLTATTHSRIFRCGIATLLATIMLAALSPWSVEPAAAQSGTDRLLSGEQLHRGEYLSSKNGLYELRMQNDGNLVIYRMKNPVTATWSTRTDISLPPPYYDEKWLGNQGDGNLVVYTQAQPYRAMWNSGTAGRGASTLIMQDDGNLVLYRNGGGYTWASNTASGVTPDYSCISNTVLGSYYNVPSPTIPNLDGQRPDAWLHGLGRVSAWGAPCNSWIQTTIERKQCDWNGCSWVDRAQTPKVRMNYRGWTFTEVQTVCKEGIHSYRVRVDVGYFTIGDSGGATVKTTWGPVAQWNCTGIGA